VLELGLGLGLGVGSDAGLGAMQRIIDSWLPVHDPRDRGPVTGSRCTTYKIL